MSVASDIAKGIVTRFPQHWDWKRALTYAGVTGGGAAGLSLLISKLRKHDKRKRTLNAIISGLSGALGGTALYTGLQNFMQLTGGLPLGGQNQLPAVDTDDKTPGKHYIVYIGGMNTAPRYAKKLIPGANMAVLDWGQQDKAVNFINSLRAKDKVTLIGHSTGGGTAIAVADKVNRPVDKLITLDPVVLNPVKRLLQMFRVRKPKSAVTAQNYIPQDYKLKDSSNGFLSKTNPILLRQVPGMNNTVIPNQAHGLWSTGYRATPQSAQTLLNVKKKVVSI